MSWLLKLFAFLKIFRRNFNNLINFHLTLKFFYRDLLLPPSSIRDNLAFDYQRDLYKVLKSKESRKLSPWVWHRLRSGDMVYLHLQKHNYSWQVPENFDVSMSQYLSTQDLADVVERINRNVEKDEQFKTSLEPFFLKFQVFYLKLFRT